MFTAAYIGLFLPLLGFLILSASWRRISRSLASWIGCSTVGLSFLSFIYLSYLHGISNAEYHNLTLFSWIPYRGIDANFMLTIDSLSLLMTLIITGIGFLIHLYSVGYTDHEESFARYFACMNLFVFAMLLLVLAGHLLLLFVGWEGVGLASYLLIGYYYTRPEAASAATKAFVMNRIGDLGLLLGLLLTFHLFGTGTITEISERVGKEFTAGATILTILTLLYFIGSIGKSAQLPLYTWLPDAMEGPTPVSALIHAATMVTAGVYLIVRMHEVFSLAPETLQVVGVVGGVTSLFAAVCALGQTDLKRVLAYSTVSQLGLMFLACGVGAYYTAMFHLTTHAFTKALLFLSAGNIVHMLHGVTDMNKMGGLSKIFTKTHWLFLIGLVALSGVPPLSNFFSKDMILEVEHLEGQNVLFIVGLIASILTGIYLTRAYCLTFRGTAKMAQDFLKTVREAPAIMIIPVSILGLLSATGGFLGFGFGSIPLLEQFLTTIDVTQEEYQFLHESLLNPVTVLTVLSVLTGILATAVVYTRYVDRLGPTLSLLTHSFYVNEIYDTLFVKPLKTLARWIAHFFEPRVFEGSIRFLERGSQTIAGWFQEMQSGEIRSYYAWMVAGMTLLIVYFVS